MSVKAKTMFRIQYFEANGCRGFLCFTAKNDAGAKFYASEWVIRNAQWLRQNGNYEVVLLKDLEVFSLPNVQEEGESK